MSGMFPSFIVDMLARAGDYRSWHGTNLRGSNRRLTGAKREFFQGSDFFNRPPHEERRRERRA